MYSEREKLLEDLRRIKKNEFQLDQGENAYDYIDLMLKYIGDPDPELRDELIYVALWQWTCEKNYISNDELNKMVPILIDDQHLFYGIGNCGDNTVFTRTFSVLTLALVIYRHNKSAFLDQGMFTKVKKSLLRYYREEKDLRGYTEENGWAHGAAHCADAFDELIQCKESDEILCREILEVIENMLYNRGHIFADEEDERIANIVIRMIEQKMLPDKVIEDWLEGLCQCNDWERGLDKYRTRVNSKNFIRCIYFRLLHNNIAPYMYDMLIGIEKKLNTFI